MIDTSGPWGTGPFILKSGFSVLDKRAPELVLVPNPDHWNAARRPKNEIRFDNLMSKEEGLQALKAGKVDIVTELTSAEAASLADSKTAKVVRNDAKTILVGVFNQTAPNSRWRDARLRKALNHAVDKEAVVKNGALGYGTVVAAFIKPGDFGANSALKPYAFNQAEAKKLWKQAGAKAAPVTIVAGATYKPVVEGIAKNLEGIGLKVNPVWADAPKGDDWDIWLVEHFDWSPEFPVGVVHREFFAKDGGFRKMDVDPKFEQMLEKIVATPDRAAQEKLVQQIEQYVYKQANVLFLYSPAKLYGVSNRVKFVPYRTTVLELAEASISK